MATNVTLKAPGHIHTDRSRERRSNSGKSDDSTYPKIKTPSIQDTIIDTRIIDEDDGLKKTGDVESTEVRKPRESKKHRKKRHLIPPERTKKRQSQLSEDSHIYQNISQFTELDLPHPPVQMSLLNKNKPKRSTSSPDVTQVIRKSRSNPNEGNGINIKRSISITLPNNLNHKLRKRMHTAGFESDAKDNHERELRHRSSKLNNGKTQHEHEKQRRGRRGSDLEGHHSLLTQRAPKNVPADANEPRSSRKKHYSSYHNTNAAALEHNSNLQDLLYHFTEIEKRNKDRREKQQSRKSLGFSDQVSRHDDFNNVNLYEYIKDSRAAQSSAAAPKKDRLKRSDKRHGYVVSQVLPPSEEKLRRTKSFNADDQAYSKHKSNTRRHRKKVDESIDEQFSTMTIGSVYNTGVPDNHCSISTAGNLETATVTLSQSDSDRFSVKSVSPVKESTSKKQSLKEVSPITTNRNREPFSNKRPSKHYIEYTKVDGSEPVKGRKRKGIQKVEVLPSNHEVELGVKIQKRKPRHRYFTREQDITETSYVDTREPRDRSVSKRSSHRAEHHGKQAARSLETQDEVTINGGDSEEGECTSANNNIVKMLKKIDKQSLKEKLSLDKLDSFGTDDESHLDRMLESITAFVEGKIRRKRCKTNGGLRFGSSTVHVYDPMVITVPFGEKQHVRKPKSILKKRT